MTRRAPADDKKDLDLVQAATAAYEKAAHELAELQRRSAEARRNLEKAEAGVRDAGVQLAKDDPAGPEAYETAVAEVSRLRAQVAGFTEVLLPQADAAATRAWEALEEARRTAAADEAEALAAAVAAQLEERYEVLRSEIHDLQSAVREANRRVREVNENLPEDRPPVALPEARVRDLPAVAGGVISEEVVSLWVFADTLAPVPEGRVQDIQATGRDHHQLPSRSHGVAGGRRVELRRLQRVVIQEPRAAARGPQICEVSLPPLRPSPPDPSTRVELRPLEPERAAQP